MTHSGVSRRTFCSRLLSLGLFNFGSQDSLLRGLLPTAQRHSQFGPAAAGAEPQITFRDVAAEAGITPKLVCGTPEKKYIIEVNGTGCVWFDYNNDGYVDLYIVNGSTIDQLLRPSNSGSPTRNYLFRNNGDGTFTDVTRAAHVEGRGWGCGAVAADYNNDGNVDLFVYTYGKNILYRNNGDGTFTDATEQAGVGGDPSWSAGAAFGDYDNDGFLDLYVSRYLDFDVHRLADYDHMTCQFKGIKVAACGPRGFRGAPDVLYHNNGDGTFTDVTAKAGVTDTKLYYGFSVAFEDFDGDGRPDILVANDSNPNYFYHNKGDGSFEEVGVTAGIAYNGEGLEQSNMGLALGDIDNDGWTDVFITEFAEDNFTLFHNDGKGIFSDISYPSGVAEATIPNLGWATFFIDYNNDGLKDLFCVNGHVYPEAERAKGSSYRQPPLLLANVGNRRFKPVNSQVGLAALRLPGRGGAFCDYDNDGDLDVAIVNIDERPTLLRNDGGNQAGHWLQVKTIGVKSNRDGIGAAVKVVAGDLTQYDRVRTGGSFCSSNDTRLHFGLGRRDLVDLVEIRWPSGTVDRLTHLDPNQVVVVREGQGRIPSPYRPLRRAPNSGHEGGHNKG
ncbi:MAG TPA: CRTAC1 family protein [Terriglobia bacterium]|nr:CRTAC1 family protein [Terriglobia bacterium]